MSQPALSLPRLIAYGLPGLPLAALLLPLFIYLPAYYADDLGLGFAVVGLVLVVARLGDVVTDPIIGLLSDRIATPFGRRRFWLVAGTPVTLISAHMLFNPAADAGPIYLLIWALVAYLGVTMVLLPYSAWGAELSPDYHQRSTITGAREGFVVLGTLLAAALPIAFGADRSAALAGLSQALWFILPATVIVAVAAVPERPYVPRPPAGWRRAAAVLWQNQPFRRLLFAYLLNGIANGLPASLFLLFVAHVIVAPDLTGLFLFAYFASGVAAIPVWLRLSRRFSKHRVWSAAMLWANAVFLLVPFLGPGDVVGFFLVSVFTGVSLGADLTLPPSMQADVVDLDTVRSRRRRAGIYFAIWGVATKLALALAVGIAFPLLDAAGFSGDAASNTDTALFVLVALYCLLPVACKLTAVALLWRYPITADRQRRIRRLIERRAAQREFDHDPGAQTQARDVFRVPHDSVGMRRREA